MVAVPDTSYVQQQLEAVVTDSGNVGELESSTPGLAFASDVWTYMTSHILVTSLPLLPSCILNSLLLLGHLSRHHCHPRTLTKIVHRVYDYNDDGLRTTVIWVLEYHELETAMGKLGCCVF